MIQHIPIKTDKKPFYKVKFKYDVGDSEGYHTTRCKVSVDNPYLEKLLVALKKLKKPENYRGWGITLDNDMFGYNWDNDFITKEERDLLFLIRYDVDGKDDFAYELSGLIANLPGNMGRYVLYTGYKLEYVDENGVKFNTKIK